MRINDTWWVNPRQLDEDQKHVIAAPIDKSHLVLGPPGSGKSNLLLLRADYLQKAGYPNSIILVFTRQLQEFMVAGSSNYSFQASKIKTSRSWMLDLLRQHDINIELSNDFEESRIQLLRAAQELIQSKNISALYESILLDEAQDYLPDEIQLFSKLCKRMFVVADTRQKIYLGTDSINTIQSIVEKTHTLRFHYRNGLKICRLADGIAKESEDYQPLASTSNYDEHKTPSTVEVIRTNTLEEQCNIILERIKVQLKAYPNEHIGIITPRREELFSLSQFFVQTDLYSDDLLQVREDGSGCFNYNRPIVLTTLHSAKGLEFRALHIAALDRVKRFEKQRNMCFTAVTRAKTALCAYHTEGLPGYFEQACADMQRPPALPKIEDLFTKEAK